MIKLVVALALSLIALNIMCHHWKDRLKEAWDRLLWRKD